MKGFRFSCLMFVLIALAVFFLGEAFAQLTATATAVAAAPVAPTANEIMDAIANLLLNWKVLGPWGICSSIIIIIVMLLKSDWTDFFFKWSTKGPLVKQAIIVILGQVIGIMAAISQGTKWPTAIVAGLFVSGGAIVIYNAIKPLFKKVEVQINSAAKPL